MKAAAFDYRSPATLAESLQLLAAGEGRAKAMGGGQSFGPMLNLRLTRPQTVVDVSRLPGCEEVRVDAEHIVIGAGVTHATIEDGLHAALRGHPMQAVAAGIAYRAIRNRGTVGGSLAHADPAADWIVTLTALDAQLQLSSPRGERSVAMDRFMQAAYTTLLAIDEIITAVRVPKAAHGHWGYYKFCRKPGEFAEASAAVWKPATGPTRVVLGALDGAPLLLTDLAQAIDREGMAATGRPQLAQAVRHALPGHDAVDTQLHAVCLARALAQAGLAAPTAAAPLETTA
jgi:carbon-monoxide dehydrogenase medium subunit